MAKIAIDAGQGKNTAGKRCLKSLDKNETREWVLNDRVATALGTYLKSAGHEILRVDDTDGTLTANYYVLRKTTMPASLTECGFMDSATDIKYILDPNWSKKIALGIAEGICGNNCRFKTPYRS